MHFMKKKNNNKKQKQIIIFFTKNHTYEIQEFFCGV